MNHTLQHPSPVIDFEAFTENYITAMDARYGRIFLCYGVMVVAGILILELRKREKISAEFAFKILTYIHASHLAMAIWLLFPMLF